MGGAVGGEVKDGLVGVMRPVEEAGWVAVLGAVGITDGGVPTVAPQVMQSFKLASKGDKHVGIVTIVSVVQASA